jgi:hypothetical protein
VVGDEARPSPILWNESDPGSQRRSRGTDGSLSAGQLDRSVIGLIYPEEDSKELGSPAA